MTRAEARRLILAGEAPPGLTVGRSLDLSYCTSLTALPPDLTVWGNLYLDGCTALTALPEGLTVGGDLYLSYCTSLASLPERLTVGDSLYLTGCTALRNVVRGGKDRRGYEFYGARLAYGPRVLAGCRNFSPAQARKHWPEGSECRALAEAVIRELEQ